MLNKKEVQHTIDQMPEEFSIDELLDKLRFLSKINRGLEEVKAGEVKTHEEARDTIRTWFS